MYFIDQVHLITPNGRRVLHVFQQFASIFNLGAGGRIYLNQVNKTPFINGGASTALATGLGTNPHLTIQAFGQNTSNGRFTHTTGAGKQIGMVQAIMIQRIDQRL